MTLLNPGDVCRAPQGTLWRVRTIEKSGLVIAEHIDTGTVSHFDAETLTIWERHPGGAGGGQS